MLKLAKEKQLLNVDYLMKVIFSDELRISIHQGDDAELLFGNIQIIHGAFKKLMVHTSLCIRKVSRLFCTGI